uniref:Caspase domain-containing protein n=1 Tax=Candidatus Kentrum sp. FW TaxID=2126338 RepID=A0A450T6E4_9GAMM|nr:MAG: Caspase domain-containing protein [Candidatus Kentron sp. FW]VFJ62276.1 MAG: Caspase domain-containing protein [Candidatus Kentron sp. FW]
MQSSDKEVVFRPRAGFLRAVLLFCLFFPALSVAKPGLQQEAYPTMVIAIGQKELSQDLQGVSLDLATVQQTLTKALTKKGFRIVEAPALEAEKLRQANLAGASGNTLSAAIEAASHLADIMLVGQAVAQDNGAHPYNARLHSYGAFLSAKVYETGSGRLLASGSAEANVPHHSFAIGSQRAMQKAADKLTQELSEQIGKVRPNRCDDLDVALIVEGLSFGQIKSLRNHITGKVKGISRFTKKHFLRGRADIILGWNSCDVMGLAERLDGITVKSDRLEILEVRGNSIRGRIVPGPDPKPVPSYAKRTTDSKVDDNEDNEIPIPDIRIDNPEIPADEPRIALVIGNWTYKSSPLTNPQHDASAMAKALRAVRFQVIHRENLSRKSFHHAVREFGDRIHKGGVGLFFYAGHGMQVKGKNYLIPVGSDIAREDEIVDEAVDMSLVLRKMETAKNRLNIIMLDACRNNPFARSFRSATRGLARIDVPMEMEMFIAYATAPGDVAADGTGKNSPYTKAFVDNVQSPGLSIEQLFKRIRISVSKETRGRQVPWESTSLRGDFFFKTGD